VGPKSVGIATGYGLDGPGIKFRRGRDFGYPSRPTLESTQLRVQPVPSLFLVDKAAGVWVWPPIPSRAEVIERVNPTSTPPLDLHGREQGELHLELYFKYMCLFCVCRAKNGTECVGQGATWPKTWSHFSSLSLCLKWKNEIMSAALFILCFHYYPRLNPEQ
jgi:hypothetical protein